jgi:hypothetical protein
VPFWRKINIPQGGVFPSKCTENQDLEQSDPTLTFRNRLTLTFWGIVRKIQKKELWLLHSEYLSDRMAKLYLRYRPLSSRNFRWVWENFFFGRGGNSGRERMQFVIFVNFVTCQFFISPYVVAKEKTRNIM